MTDQQFLKEYVNAAKILLSSSSTKDIVTIKDADLKILTLSYTMLDFLGLDSAGKIIGKKFEDITDILPFGSKLIEKFRQQNMEILDSKKNKVYLEIISLNGKSKIYIVYKTPIINPDTSNCVGIRIEFNKMYWPNITKALFIMRGAKGLLIGKNDKSTPFETYPLSEMQHMILYLCLGNHSYSEIAIFMNEFGYKITPLRVNDYLEQLKLIFHVRTKVQLIEKAIGLNFHTFLPSGLFNCIDSIDITDEPAEIISMSMMTKSYG